MYSKISLAEDVEVFFSGPSLEEGPLPALIYLSISGEDSLNLDPFNQPVLFLLQNHKMRVFSLTLPAHEPPIRPADSLSLWAEDFAKGYDPLTPFILKVAKVADLLKLEKIASKVGIAGLSRGGFLAIHAAAHSEVLHDVLAFAPITSLRYTKEFAPLRNNLLIDHLSLDLLNPRLIHKAIRCYIGNRDERVSTSSCFSFMANLVEEAFNNKIRSPQVELMISPSVGYLGHGTPKHIFEDGAAWIGKKIFIGTA